MSIFKSPAKQATKDEANQVLLLNKRLNTILEVTRAVNDNISTQSLYKLFQLVITNQTGVKNLQYYTFDKIWYRVFNYGDIETEPDISKLILKYEEASELSFIDKRKYSGINYIIPIKHQGNIVAVVLASDFQSNSNEDDKTLLNFLQVISNIVAVSIENQRLLKREKDRIELNKELEFASKIQHILVPDKLPSNTLYEFAGLYVPHHGIGGDYYDVFNINKNEIVFCIADISGKGIAAALLMANLQAYLNAQENIELGEKFIKKLNNKVFNITNGENFITLFIAKYNMINKELQYINAGHNPPLLISEDKLTPLTEGCTILGIFEQIDTLKIGSVKLKPNDTIVCYTDGLTELKNDNGSQYSYKRLEQFCRENAKLGPDVFLKTLHNSLSKFKGNTLFDDDISILCCKIL